MADIKTGGCLCGALRYELSGDPVYSFLCHCRTCQKSSGSAFSAGMLVQEEQLSVLQGTLVAYAEMGESGKQVTRQFCPTCGSPLFSLLEIRPGSLVVSVGSLDEPSAFQPKVHLWSQSEWGWARVEDQVKRLQQGT